LGAGDAGDADNDADADADPRTIQDGGGGGGGSSSSGSDGSMSDMGCACIIHFSVSFHTLLSLFCIARFTRHTRSPYTRIRLNRCPCVGTMS